MCSTGPNGPRGLPTHGLLTPRPGCPVQEATRLRLEEERAARAHEQRVELQRQQLVAAFDRVAEHKVYVEQRLASLLEFAEGALHEVENVGDLEEEEEEATGDKADADAGPAPTAPQEGGCSAVAAAGCGAEYGGAATPGNAAPEEVAVKFT